MHHPVPILHLFTLPRLISCAMAHVVSYWSQTIEAQVSSHATVCGIYVDIVPL